MILNHTGVVSAAVLMAALAIPARPASAQPGTPATFGEQVVDAGIGETERSHAINARPEVFLQTRFAHGLVTGGTADNTRRNFQLTRIETRWSGQLSERIGVGLELQFHPALAGAAEELVNDAFVEFYATDALTVRVGQFIKPFGFDIGQSSSDREFPERGMFAGYFFPGQRDRGLMVRWAAGEHRSPLLRQTQVYAALLNGNRFFADNDGRLDTLVRVRRFVAAGRVAIGGSVQLGSQIVPPDSTASTDVRLYGADAQAGFGRFGARVEWVHGTRPSTLLGLEPEFTAAFGPATHTTGFTASTLVRIRQHGDAFVRLDRLVGDPMTGATVRAVDVGYRHSWSDRTRLSFDYQWKTNATENDDAVNTRVQATLGVIF